MDPIAEYQPVHIQPPEAKDDGARAPKIFRSHPMEGNLVVAYPDKLASDEASCLVLAQACAHGGGTPTPQKMGLRNVPLAWHHPRLGPLPALVANPDELAQIGNAESEFPARNVHIPRELDRLQLVGLLLEEEHDLTPVGDVVPNPQPAQRVCSVRRVQRRIHRRKQLGIAKAGASGEHQLPAELDDAAGCALLKFVHEPTGARVVGTLACRDDPRRPEQHGGVLQVRGDGVCSFHPRDRGPGPAGDGGRRGQGLERRGREHFDHRCAGGYEDARVRGRGLHRAAGRRRDHGVESYLASLGAVVRDGQVPNEALVGMPDARAEPEIRVEGAVERFEAWIWSRGG